MPTLFEKNNPFVYSLISDHFQNIAITFLATLSNANASYTPTAIILFSLYNLYSLSNNPPSVISKDKADFQFRYTNHLAVWHYGVNLVVLITMQILKCAFMWRGVVDLSVEDYQSLGITMGIIISFTMMGLIGANLVVFILVWVMRMSEVKTER